MAEAVSDASPLIILAKAGLLDLLPSQFSRVSVPDAVVTEIQEGPEGDPMRTKIPDLAWLDHVTLEPPLPPMGYWQLGKGESEVIEYARLNPGMIALLDDRRARGIASALDIKVRGSLGIIVKAIKTEGTITWELAVNQLKQAGLFLDDHVVRQVGQDLNEHKHDNR